MLTSAWIAAVFAVFAWWFFTGVILYVVRHSDSTEPAAHRRAVVLALPLAALGAAGVIASVGSLTIGGVYIAFLSVLLIWGWIELAFLSGVITGPERRACPQGLTGWPRFVRAWHTLSYHEFLLVLVLLAITIATAGAENKFALWTYLILFVARISAKLNLFFGVPRINTEFVPRPLNHLKSYFRKGGVTAAFPVGVTFLSVSAACFAERLITAELPALTIGFALLTALTALAAIEHWLMVIPLPDAKLWRWMLPDTTSTKGDPNEL